MADDDISPPVLLFDGDCGLCRASVRWIWAREAGTRLTYTPLQGEVGQALLAARGLPAGFLDSAVLVEPTATFTHSDAVLEALRYARAPWRLLAGLTRLPRPLRDGAYRWVAGHRPFVSGLLGTRGQRWDPPADQRPRFPHWEAGRQPG